MVKRLLRKYGYPPDKEVTATVLQQAETERCGLGIGLRES
nr:DUF3387 domain-containing protein [Nostoc sp. MS1]